MLLFRIDFDLFGLKRPRRYEKDEKKGNHSGGSKAPRTPVSVGEEYIFYAQIFPKDMDYMTSILPTP